MEWITTPLVPEMLQLSSRLFTYERVRNDVRRNAMANVLIFSPNTESSMLIHYSEGRFILHIFSPGRTTQHGRLNSSRKSPWFHDFIDSAPLRQNGGCRW